VYRHHFCVELEDNACDLGDMLNESVREVAARTRRSPQVELKEIRFYRRRFEDSRLLRVAACQLVNICWRLGGTDV
jgi:hypothetical protein